METASTLYLQNYINKSKKIFTYFKYYRKLMNNNKSANHMFINNFYVQNKQNQNRIKRKYGQ